MILYIENSTWIASITKTLTNAVERVHNSKLYKYIYSIFFLIISEEFLRFQIPLTSGILHIYKNKSVTGEMSDNFMAVFFPSLYFSFCSAKIKQRRDV